SPFIHHLMPIGLNQAYVRSARHISTSTQRNGGFQPNLLSVPMMICWTTRLTNSNGRACDCARLPKAVALCGFVDSKQRTTSCRCNSITRSGMTLKSEGDSLFQGGKSP